MSPKWESSFELGFSQNILKDFGPSINNSFIGMGSLIVGAVLLSPFLFVYGEANLSISSTSWLYIAILGIINTSLAYVIFIKLIKRIGSLNASFVTYLVPVSSISLGILILDEVFTLDMVIGSALIFLGVFFSNKQATK